mmetsp:Transcript_33922/g.33046  ORF Transcript_33922/g.33046 Transcript_33922/m.33046 type:complete len:89 (+) Transcript_33922:520-786(+)
MSYYKVNPNDKESEQKIQWVEKAAEQEPDYSYLLLSDHLFDTFLQLLKDYEDNGDIVETIYVLLGHYLLLAKCSLKASPKKKNLGVLD